MIARCALLSGAPSARQIDRGKRAISQLEKRFPRSRFRGAAQGLRGRIWYLQKQYSLALQCFFAVEDLSSVEIVCNEMPDGIDRWKARARLFGEYLERFANASNIDSFESRANDLWRTRRLMSRADAAEFSRLLLRSPDIAASYFYYRLYHCKNKRRDLANLGELADEIDRRIPTWRMPPMVRVRLAEVYYQQRKYNKALIWVGRAIAVKQIDRALFVRGATLHKLNRHRHAINAFTAMLRRFPNSPLRRAAHEELAILYESVVDLGKALDHYITLGYQTDIAYLLDVRMATREIRSFIERNPRHPMRDLIAYALGIRYMRDEQWHHAERWLRSVPVATRIKFGYGRLTLASRPSPDPLKAISELSKLHRAAANARSSDARAESLFRYGSYYHTHGTLLLYNAALWQGKRAYNFDFWWNSDHASRDDVSATHDYMYRHDVYARSRAICLRVAREFPTTPVAPRALYRAACATRYLAEFNYWWGREDSRKNFGRESVELMQSLVRMYPNHKLSHDARKYAALWRHQIVRSSSASRGSRGQRQTS